MLLRIAVAVGSLFVLRWVARVYRAIVSIRRVSRAFVVTERIAERKLKVFNWISNPVFDELIHCECSPTNTWYHPRRELYVCKQT